MSFPEFHAPDTRHTLVRLSWRCYEYATRKLLPWNLSRTVCRAVGEYRMRTLEVGGVNFTRRRRRRRGVVGGTVWRPWSAALSRSLTRRVAAEICADGTANYSPRRAAEAAEAAAAGETVYRPSVRPSVVVYLAFSLQIWSDVRIFNGTRRGHLELLQCTATVSLICQRSPSPHCATACWNIATHQIIIIK